MPLIQNCDDLLSAVISGLCLPGVMTVPAVTGVVNMDSCILGTVDGGVWLVVARFMAVCCLHNTVLHVLVLLVFLYI